MLQVIQGDALEKLRELPDESAQCCVTSPPYWGLRDYGTAAWEGGTDECEHAAPIESGNSGNKSNSQTHPGRFVDCKCGARRIDSQLGLEKTPEEYVAKMVEVFREVRRVLRKDGTLWLNLGDSYNAAREGGHAGGTNGISKPENAPQRSGVNAPGLKPKDLCGIPWRVAFALQADGWWLRSDIIWAKPNPMPESVTDRPTKSHEYLFLLTKSANYFYDAEAIREPNLEASLRRDEAGWNAAFVGRHTMPGEKRPHSTDHNGFCNPAGRNKRSVWMVATAPYSGAHFATFPPDLIKPCIMAGTSAKGCCVKCGAPWERIVERTKYQPPIAENGERFVDENRGDKNRKLSGKDYNDQVSSKTLGWQPTCKHVPCGVIPCKVLDPLAGSGTTGEVALELGRKAILIELNPAYVKLIKQRCDVTMGLALA